MVDGATVGEANAGTAAQSYSFNATLSPDTPHSIQVVFDNDALIDGQDRNLLLQSISVNGREVPATDNAVVYHATGGPGDLPPRDPGARVGDVLARVLADTPIP